MLEKLTLGGGVNWQDDHYSATENPLSDKPERLEQDAYALVNIMARYDINRQLSAQLNIKNLLDETYYDQIDFYHRVSFGEPRNINLNIKYQF